MGKEYRDSFSSWEDVSSNFGSGSWDSRSINLAEPEHVFAIYDGGGYEGSALVLYKDVGGFHSVEGSHCSCFGLEDQWEPHGETLETIRHQATESSWGLWHRYGQEIVAWLDAATREDGRQEAGS